MTANIDANLANWSTTDASNQPDGTDTADIDAEFRRLQSTVRKYLATKGSDLASGSTVDLSTATGNVVTVTGTTTITSLGTVSAGMRFTLIFDGALTLTHSASLILPGASNITTAAGDTGEFLSLGSGNWRCLRFSSSAGVVYSPSGTGSVTTTVQAKLREMVSVKDFGAVGDGVTDDTAAIQAAIDAGIGSVVYFPAGTYIISSSINLKTQRNLRGAMTGSIIKASASWSPAVPTVTASTYTPTLSFAPLMYNKDSIDWFSIEGIELDGSNQDCYGLWLMENFHGTLRNVLVYQTNKRPYTNIRGQSITHENFTCYDCDEGVVTYDNTGFAFIGCGWERIAADWAYDQRQPNTGSKGGVLIEQGWFESASGATVTEGFLRMSGRRNRVSGHFTHYTTATTERFLELNDNTASVVVDGITMTSAPCVRGRFDVNNASGQMLIKTTTNTSGNAITGAFTASKVTDSGVGNTFDVNASLATPVQHITGRFQVRNGDTGTGIPIGATNFVLDADFNAGTPLIKLLGNVNNYFDLNAGKLRLNSNLGQDYVTASGGFTWNASSGGYVFSGSSGATGYQKPIYAGSYALWVDSAGKLRIKSGVPASDTDGTIVGTQS